MKITPKNAPAGIQMAENPALEANSAPAMKVPEPIQVQIKVKTITQVLIDRPATMNSSWVLIFFAR
jgi:hypothetical protein